MSNPPSPSRAPLFDGAQVRRLAQLARLELTDDEVLRMGDELARIVAHVATLSEHNDDSPGAPLGAMPLRDDEPHASLPHDRALAEAPHAVEGGFAVPTFVDEG